MKFLDVTRIYLKSGAGGNGAVSFRRAAHVEYGGPDGGNGGNGGSVYAKAVNNLNTLIDFRYRQHFFAENGKAGKGRQRSGRHGRDIILKVPLGTEILEADAKTRIADLINPNDCLLLAKGGNGGFGNLHFKSSTNQAPRWANQGQASIEREIWLRLKLIADVGLIGLPNAGKSTFLSVVSNARPNIAPYPFTTLHPNLGVVRIKDKELVMADIPGLIAGSHNGVGLGHRFLAHIERCAALVHLIDSTSNDIVGDYKVIINELHHYDHNLLDLPKITVLNKIDALDAVKNASQLAQLRDSAAGMVLAMSGVSGRGVQEVLRHLLLLTIKPNTTQDCQGIKKWCP